MIRELSREEFLTTMGSGMKDITQDAESVVDIWGYAGSLLSEGLISRYGFDNRLIEAVYGDEEGRYHHVLLFTEQSNRYIVIVIDTEKKVILGHHLLDLNEEYGIDLSSKEE